MQADVQERIERAKNLLNTVSHAAMATVNADGTPHNTPFFFVLDSHVQHVYWGSHPDSQHSQNIARTGQLFVVIYDAVNRGGLYMQCGGGHILEGDELAAALDLHNQKRQKLDKELLTVEYYTNSPQRMFGADIQKMWVCLAEHDEQGLTIKDYRHEISATDLL